MPYESHQRCRLFLAVDSSLPTRRAPITRMERGVRDGNPMSAGKRRGAIATMSLASRHAGIRLVHGPSILRQNDLGFLRTPFPCQSFCQGMQRGLQLLAFRFAQRRMRAAIDESMPFLPSTASIATRTRICGVI